MTEILIAIIMALQAAQWLDLRARLMRLESLFITPEVKEREVPNHA